MCPLTNMEIENAQGLLFDGLESGMGMELSCMLIKGRLKWPMVGCKRADLSHFLIAA
jgi:hypothetical protein